MKSLQNNQDRLREALRSAYRAREEERIDTDELWRIKIMSQIRRLGPPDRQKNATTLFNQYLWRLTPALCVLLVMLSVAVAAVDFSPEYEITQFFMNDPVEYTVAQLWE